MTTNTSPGENQQVIASQGVGSTHPTKSLDVLRGIGLLAALFISIRIFSGFGPQMQSHLIVSAKGGNYGLYAAMEFLFDGKMRALIAIVFGASMVIFFSKNSNDSLKPGEVFIRRQIALIILGLINALIFLWTHDILFHLGVMGILVFPFIRLSNRGLFIAALLVTLIYSGKLFWNYADDKKNHRKYETLTALSKKYNDDSTAKAKQGLKVKKDTLTKLEKEDTSAWSNRLSSMKVDVKKDEGDKKTMREVAYWKTWNYLVPRIQSREAQWTYEKGIWDLGGMIFLGMLLYRIGFFNNRFSSKTYLLLTLLCFAGGFLFGWFRLHHQQLALTDYLKYINRHLLPYDFFFPFERALVALGFVSMVMLLLPVKLFHPVWRAFASAGQLALSNYLIQSIVCTIFFYGYGMGYFGILNQIQLYFFVLEVIMVQMVLSIIWLRYYNYGPAEWLLRRVSYGRPLPGSFRKSPAVEPVIPALT